MIGNGHLQFLQQLIDSQMETSCQIAFEFVDQEQLKDPVCYLKKAFFLMQDIMEDTMRFKDNTPNAYVIVKLQELSLRLKSCFTKDYEEQGKVGVFWSRELGVRAEGGFGGPTPAQIHRGCSHVSPTLPQPWVIAHSRSHSWIHPTHLC